MINDKECATDDMRPAAANSNCEGGISPAGHQHDPKLLSACIKRAAVPNYFPQFRSAGSLAHLAHIGRGPRYVLVGGRAWYDVSDIEMWLNQIKRIGPDLAAKDAQNRHANPPPTEAQRKKRGRPTKAEQMRRRRGF